MGWRGGGGQPLRGGRDRFDHAKARHSLTRVKARHSVTSKHHSRRQTRHQSAAQDTLNLSGRCVFLSEIKFTKQNKKQEAECDPLFSIAQTVTRFTESIKFYAKENAMKLMYISLSVNVACLFVCLCVCLCMTVCVLVCLVLCCI